MDRTVRERQNNRAHADPGLREELEKEVERLMSAVTAIINIHELSPSPVGGNTWTSLESHYLQLHQGRSTGPRRFVLPNLNTALSQPHLMNIAVVAFWGMVRNRCGSHRTTE
jgi:hypothetical protein